MSLPDILILIVVLLFAFSGVRRGMMWELFTAIGLALGFLLVYAFRSDFQNLVVRFTPEGWPRQWVSVLVFLAAFLVVYLGFAAIGGKIHNKLEKTAFKWPDRVLGVLAGIAKGIVLIGLLVIATEWFDQGGHVKHFLNQSKLIRWGKTALYNMTHWESEEKREWI